MKRFLLLGLLTVSVVSMSGCRWCGWAREGDVCNACQAPTAYAGESYYGGTVYEGDIYGGQIVEGQTIQPGMPTIETIPAPQGGAR